MTDTDMLVIVAENVAVNQEAALSNVMASLNDKFGKGTVMKLSSKEDMSMSVSWLALPA